LQIYHVIIIPYTRKKLTSIAKHETLFRLRKRHDCLSKENLISTSQQNISRKTRMQKHDFPSADSPGKVEATKFQPRNPHRQHALSGSSKRVFEITMLKNKLPLEEHL